MASAQDIMRIMLENSLAHNEEAALWERLSFEKIGPSPLHIAAGLGQVGAMSLLLERGAHLQASAARRIMWALSAQNDVELVSFLKELLVQNMLAISSKIHKRGDGRAQIFG